MIDRYLTNAARHTPYAPAIATLHGDVTYARFDHEVSLVAGWLSRLNLDPQRPVVVCCAEKYLHWLLLLGCARCDIATASVSDFTPAGVVEAISPQLFLTDREPASLGGSDGFEVLRLTPDLARDMLKSTLPGRQRLGKSDAQRLSRISTSSGTTGVPKRIGLTAERVERRLPNLLRLAPTALMRFLPLVGPESGGFEACLSVWASGGTVVFAPNALGDLSEGLARLAPTALAGAPIQLQHLLAATPAQAPPIGGMSLMLFGAHAPMSLRAELTRRLTASVFNAFGSTECGLIAGAQLAQLTDPSCAGFVHPWVDVDIVDDDDQPVRVGELGRLRVRSPDAVDHYMGDTAASAKSFKDGWFHPGDLGSLAADGMLRLEGRSDDVINAGGEKMLPLRLEEAARAVAGVDDAAGFMAPGKSGVDVAWVAVVSAAAIDKVALSKAFASLGAPEVNIAWVGCIPRNERGKIKRDQLRQDLVQTLDSARLADPG